MDANAGVGDACPLPVLSPTLSSGERYERLAAIIAHIAADRATVLGIAGVCT
jgi:hypothetical protein